MLKPVLAAALAVAAVGATAATAQAPAVPEVTIGLGKSAVTLTGAENLQGGPTKITLTNPDGLKENFGGVFLLRAGMSLDDFRAKVDEGGQEAVWGLGSMEAASGLEGAQATASTTLTLQPGGTYAAFQAVSDDPKEWVYASFTVGTGNNGAALPQPDATVDMDDFAFAGDRVLPRNGTIRFRNVGTAPHFAVAFPLKPKAKYKGFARAIRTNNEKGLGKFIGGAPGEIQGIVSAGAVNTTDVEFARAGRYGLVCFFSTRENRKGHHEIGMIRQVRVR